jgi:hypothetical protein
MFVFKLTKNILGNRWRFRLNRVSIMHQSLCICHFTWLVILKKLTFFVFISSFMFSSLSVCLSCLFFAPLHLLRTAKFVSDLLLLRNPTWQLLSCLHVTLFLLVYPLCVSHISDLPLMCVTHFWFIPYVCHTFLTHCMDHVCKIWKLMQTLYRQACSTYTDCNQYQDITLHWISAWI